MSSEKRKLNTEPDNVISGHISSVDNTLDKLPSDILIHIATYLDDIAFVTELQLTCKSIDKTVRNNLCYIDRKIESRKSLVVVKPHTESTEHLKYQGAKHYSYYTARDGIFHSYNNSPSVVNVVSTGPLDAPLHRFIVYEWHHDGVRHNICGGPSIVVRDFTQSSLGLACYFEHGKLQRISYGAVIIASRQQPRITFVDVTPVKLQMSNLSECDEFNVARYMSKFINTSRL